MYAYRLLRRAAAGSRSLAQFSETGTPMKRRTKWPESRARVLFSDTFQMKETHYGNRQFSVLFNASSWVQDVISRRSLNPPNAILESMIFDEVDKRNLSLSSKLGKLPLFSKMLPYHLKSAAQEVARHYQVDLANLEVSITAQEHTSTVSIIDALDRLEAPMSHLLEVGDTLSKLSDDPDEISQWEKALDAAKLILNDLPQKESPIIFKALMKLQGGTPLTIVNGFRKAGADIPDEESGSREELKRIQNKLVELTNRFSSYPDVNHASKADRLQAVSDMYNVIGLSSHQAKKLGYDNVFSLEQDSRMATIDQIHALHDEVANFVRPHVLSKVKVDEDIVAEFIPSQDDQPTETQKNLWRTQMTVKKLLTLDGVLQGIFDLSEAFFGIKIEEQVHHDGWYKDVRLFHLFDSDSNEDSPYLGSIYIDPYNHREKTNRSFASLFTKRRNQTIAPIAVISLHIDKPLWDDDPVPLTWNDTRSVLYQFGKAIQLVLSQSGDVGDGTSTPSDVSEFMGYFMELWLQNDGFVKRLADLSQDRMVFEQNLIDVLRSELAKQKIEEIMQHVFLGELEMSVFTDFDIGGEETLVALQARLAEKYIPHHVPGSNDLSPLMEVFQESVINQTAAYRYLWSEVLSANVYSTFKQTNIKDADEVKRLGRGVRQLFLKSDREAPLSLADFESLCGGKISAEKLQEVYEI